MPPDFIKLRETFDQYNEEGEGRLRLCLELTLYYVETFKENAAGINQFYQQCLDPLRPHLTFYDVDGKNRYKKIKDDTLDLLPFWASDEATERSVYGLKLESGKAPLDISDRAFQMYEWMFPGYVRLVLPLEYSYDAATFVAFARDATAGLQFISGFAGYGTNMYTDYPAWMENGPVYALSRRYRGVEFGRPEAFADYMEDGIKSINWLTFLGPEWTEKVGGGEALRAQFSPEIVVHDLPNGLMIQAGPMPELGDVNRRETLPYYHEVGQALRALRIPGEVLRGYDGIGGTDNTEAWLYRFMNNQDDA